MYKQLFVINVSKTGKIIYIKQKNFVKFVIRFKRSS